MSFSTSGYSSLKTSQTLECSSNKKVGYSNLHLLHFMSCLPTHSSIWMVNTLKSTISPHYAQGIRSKGFDRIVLFLTSDLVNRLEQARVWMSRHRVIILAPQRVQGLVSYCICKSIMSQSLGLYKKYHYVKRSVISFLGACYLGLGVFYDLVDDVLARFLLPRSVCLVVSHLGLYLFQLFLLLFMFFFQFRHLSIQILFLLCYYSHFQSIIIVLFVMKLGNLVYFQPHPLLTFFLRYNLSISLS